MRRYVKYSWRIGALAVLALASAGCTPATNGNDSGEAAAAPEGAVPATESEFTVRHTMSQTYAAGSPLNVAVTMDYTGDDPVTALALQVTLPDGWQFAGVTGDLRPAIEPPAGTRDTLAFVWIQIPAFPAVFEYVLDVPTDMEGPQKLEAQAIYRALAGELRSPAETITLAPR